MKDVIKRYEDLGLIIIDRDIGEEYCHPKIKISDDYYLLFQGDKTKSYLYAPYIYNKDGLWLSLINLDSQPDSIFKFIKEFDKFKEDIDNSFKRLSICSKLNEKLEDYISQIKRYNIRKIISLREIESEYFLNLQILNNIYGGK